MSSAVSHSIPASLGHSTREAAVSAFVSTWRERLIGSLAAQFEAAVGRDAIGEAVDHVVADALAGGWRGVAGADGRAVYSEKALYAFLKRAASNDLRNYLDHIGRPAAPVYGVAADVIERVSDRHNQGAEDGWIEREAASQLREALCALNEQEQQVLMLRHVDNRERRQIAELLGLSERQVKRHLERANKRLHDQYLRVAAGETCDDGQVVVRFAFELAEPRDAKRAEAHIGHCASCRRRYTRAQAFRRSVASVVPIPLVGHAGVSARGLYAQLRGAVSRLLGRGGASADQAATGGKIAAVCLAGIAGVGAVYSAANGAPRDHHPAPAAKVATTSALPTRPAAAPVPSASLEHAQIVRTAARQAAVTRRRQERARARRVAAARKRAPAAKQVQSTDEFFSPAATPSGAPTTPTSAPAQPAPSQTTTSSSPPAEFPAP